MISSPTEWRDHVEKTHGKMHAPTVTSKPLNESQVRQRKPASTKRKREDEIPGVHVLDLSEEMPQKRARRGDDDFQLDALEGSDDSDDGESLRFFSVGPFTQTLLFSNSTS